VPARPPTPHNLSASTTSAVCTQTPAILKPVELWTGKQVISVLLRPSLDCPVFVNIELQEKGYTAGESLCPRDGYVCIVNSDLLAGRIGKGLLGGGKGGLFSVLAARYSPAVAGA
jgi:DNA-directed RNA polymerase III subunit RPC1